MTDLEVLHSALPDIGMRAQSCWTLRTRDLGSCRQKYRSGLPFPTLRDKYIASHYQPSSSEWYFCYNSEPALMYHNHSKFIIYIVHSW